MKDIKETAEEIKNAKVYVVIGASKIIAKTISLGNVPAKTAEAGK